ncbi:MAG: dicarboxylate/amino acid:cation symporter [Bacteroidaceae bacterium]|nr:dicarboxylate/amino acid:cation symporter [Bacteroidaceae bacterium]
MSISRFGLLPRLLVAIVLGIVLGPFLPLPVVRLFATVSSLFSQLLQFLIPLIIIGLVTPAIAQIGRGAGRLVLLTAAIAYGSTVCAGLLSYATGSTVFPLIIRPGEGLSAVSTEAQVTPFFTISIPPMVDVMSALVFSFMLGLGIAFFNPSGLKGIFQEFKDIVVKTIETVILPLLPLYVFGLLLGMAHTGQTIRILNTFLGIICVIFVLHVVLLLLQFSVAGIVTRRNPLRLSAGMMPAYVTALGTSSSAATIPVTLRCALRNGVSQGIAGFVIPLCATIHLSGSTLKIVACALALLLMQGHHPSFSLFLGFILMLGIMMVAAPGVPGGAIMAALGLLGSMLGMGEEEQALMIALYITMDNFGTACNVTGDGAIALVVDRIRKGVVNGE